MKVEIISKSLGKICDVRDGTHDSPKYVENGFYLLTSKNFSSGKISYEGANKISIEDYNAINKRSKVDIGDIVMPMIGTIGSPVIISQEPNFAIKNVALIKRNENVCMNYICAFLASSFFEKAIKSSKRGGTQKFVSLGDLRNLKLPLPPIAEQKRIAEILDHTQSLISKRKEAIAKLDSLTPSIFLEMFGDVVKNPKHWASDRMENLMRIRRGGSPRPIEKYLGGDVNWIKIGDGTKGSDIYIENCADKITRDGLNKTVFLEKGSLIFANCGVSLGFARILKIDGCIHDGWLSFDNIVEEKLDKLFLLKALNSITQHFRDIAPDGTQPNLNTGLMKNFHMILPPLPLQKEFAQRVEAVEKLKATHRASLSQLQVLFASLQHRAFRGEL